MKDGFKSIEIEPVECYLDFVGPAKTNDTNSRVLKGQVRISLVKPVKIRNMSIKFKGQSSVSLTEPSEIELTCPLLPKLKLPVFGRTTLPIGDHTIPWEMDIPNIYPRSIMIKRATVTYKVILTISLGITRTLTAEYPIVIRRHLLPYKELAPIIETRLFQRTVPGKFHYEIDTPQIVCIEQEHIPLAIKYISFANQKEVKTIRTRLIQIELYRRQALSKAESDLSCNNIDSLILDLDKKLTDSADYKDTHIKYIKRTVPALIHIPNESTSAWKNPCLIRHRLHPYLAFSLDSPMISVYHQLEVTFQFGMKHEEVKSRIPIIIASIPKKDALQSASNKPLSTQPDTNMMLKYAFEETAQSNFLTYRLESRTSTLMTEDDNEQLLIEGSYTTLRNGRTLPLNSVEDDIHSTSRYGNRMSNNLNSPSSVDSDPRPGLVPYNSYTSELQPFNPISTIERNVIIKRSMAATTSITAAAAAVQAAKNAAMHNSVDPQRFASAVELSSRSKDSSTPVDYSEDKRPRTTTPTRRQPLYKKHVPQPIDVDLANGKDTRNVSPFPPPRTQLPLPPQSSTSSGSDVLPALDRAQQVQSRSQLHIQPSWHNSNNRQESIEDLQSVYSEASASSSNNAPSLSSSATLSTNRSQPTLHSRPPSPVFSPAPGLPATFALRPQQDTTSQIEETFLIDSNGASSPAMNTVASSTVFTPRTTSVFRQRIALSTISSLTNDSLYIGPSAVSRDRQSANLESDILSVLMRSSAENSCISHEMPYRQVRHTPPSPSPGHYINAKLPPIPAASNQSTYSRGSNRFTMIYHGESDEEEDDCATADPAIVEYGTRTSSLPTDPSMPQMMTSSIGTDVLGEGAPPRLPRLSFGNDFDFSLNL